MCFKNLKASAFLPRILRFFHRHTWGSRLDLDLDSDLYFDLDPYFDTDHNLDLDPAPDPDLDPDLNPDLMFSDLDPDFWTDSYRNSNFDLDLELYV